MTQSPQFELVCPVIKLTNGMVSLVDPEIWVSINRHGWKAIKSRGGFYAVKTSKRNGKHKTEYLHRLIAKPAAGYEVHHINGNTLDNRKMNLQIATPQIHKELDRLRRMTKRQWP